MAQVLRQPQIVVFVVRNTGLQDDADNELRPRPLESRVGPDQKAPFRTLMGYQQVDQGKRTWLIATGCAGAVGGVATAVPFVSTFAPSERAKAAGAPVQVDISAIKPGEKLTVEWRGKPVWIVRRTKEQLDALPKLDGELADPKSERKAYPVPDYAKNEWRSIKPEYFVGVGICSH